MSAVKQFLSGKCGTGIRAAWVGEKTTTSFAVYVLVRNMSSEAYNYINDTTLQNVGLQLDKTTNVKVRVANTTTGTFATGTDASGNFYIPNLEDDPLIHRDSNGDVILDSTQWYGLRVRRFEFLGLTAGEPYNMSVFTDAVVGNDPSTGRVSSFNFEVKTLRENFFCGMSYGCDLSRWVGESGLLYQSFGDKHQWDDIAEISMNGGADIVFAQDDIKYTLTQSQASGSSGANFKYFEDPPGISSDLWVAADNWCEGPDLRDCSLNVEEQSTRSSYALVSEIIGIILSPVVLYCGMKASIESTDAGDHAGILNNTNIAFNEAYYANAMNIDYGENSYNNVKPLDTDTVNWLNGGANNDTVRDPYSVGPGTFYNNFKEDLETTAQMRLNHKLVYEYFLGRATGTQTATNSSTVPEIFSAHPEYGTTLSVDPYILKPYYRQREHPLVDIFYLNCQYHSDPTYFAGLSYDESYSSFPGNTAPAPSVVKDPAENKTLGNEQRSWLEAAIQNSTKDFIIIACGDPLQKVLAEGDHLSLDGSFSEYGQPDSIGSKSRKELNDLIAHLTANSPDKGILVLTSDHHTTCMTNEQPNILQCMSIIGRSNALRPFTAPVQGFVGQYPGWLPVHTNPTAVDQPRGVSRFVVTPDAMYAYNIEAMIGNNLSSDVAYYEAGGTEWKFVARSDHNYQKVIDTNYKLTALRSI